MPQQKPLAVTGWDSTQFEIRVYTSSEARDTNGNVAGICEMAPDGLSINPSTGLPTWRSHVLPNTQSLHPNLPMAATNSFDLPHGGSQVRVFYWDKGGYHIRNAWFDGGRWALPVPEEPWEVPLGAGRGMDAITCYDPYKGVQWSCFYSEAMGRLCEITCTPGSTDWSFSEVGFTSPDSHIQAFVKWESEHGKH